MLKKNVCSKGKKFYIFEIYLLLLKSYCKIYFEDFM